MTHLTQFVFTSEIIATLIGAFVGGLIGFGGTYFSYYLNNKGKLIFSIEKLNIEGIEANENKVNGIPWEMTLQLFVTNDSGKYKQLKLTGIRIKTPQSANHEKVDRFSPKRELLILPPKSTKTVTVNFIHLHNNPTEITFDYENMEGESKTAACFISEDDIEGYSPVTLHPFD